MTDATRLALIIGWIRAAAAEGGIWLALIVASTAVVLVLTGGPEVTDVTPLKDDKKVEIVASEGLTGFPMRAFCEDEQTKVKAFQSPDAGVTYELTRVRDGKSETVTAVYSPSGNLNFATHYYDTVAGQQSEPADPTGALACLERRAK